MTDDSNENGQVSESASPGVIAYKQLLRRVLDNRPSGTRQRLAEALGKNRSFISHIASPVYPTPIPARHVETILQVCHFGPRERAEFLELYARAHPQRIRKASRMHAYRTLSLRVPDLGNAELNASFDRLMEEFAERTARLISRNHES